MSIKTKQQRIWGKHAAVGIFFEVAAAWLRLLKNGFPHYNLSKLEKAEELLSLVNYGPAKIIDGEISQTMHAQGYFWSYHPHWAEVKCGDMLTSMDVFLKDELLWKSLEKRANHGSVNSLTDSEIRKGLKSVTGAQSVSGFRPSAAWAIYDRYCPYNATVYDPSCGWGGRMIGAFMCPKVIRYIGCEPSTKTMEGLMRMSADLRWTALTRDIEIELHQRGSEGFRHVAPGSVDLVFTSPPYFSDEGIIEDYAPGESTQSHVLFPTRESWLEGFLGQTIRNCYKLLKPDGVMVLNVSDELAEAVTDQAVKNGFVHVETLKLRLSKMMGSTKYKNCRECQHLTGEANGTDPVVPIFGGEWKKCEKHKYKTEPICVFRKKQ